MALQCEMSSIEFTEWMAYFKLEPFGEEIADLRHGVSAAVLANINRDNKTNPKPYVPQDFIYWAGPKAAQDDTGDAPILLDDPVAHSQLLKAALFGTPPG